MTNQPAVPRVLQTAGGSDRPDWPAIESAVRQLAVNYALGTDAIGRSEPETGRDLYRRTFTTDADISIAGSEDTRRRGPDEWVEFVEGTFRARDDQQTQHLIGSINVVLNDHGSGALTADMSSYMHASHRSPNGDVQIVLLTYVDHVIQAEGGWRIAKRTLYPMSAWSEHP